MYIKQNKKISPLLIQNLHFRILAWSAFSGVNNIKTNPKKKLTDKWTPIPKRNKFLERCLTLECTVKDFSLFSISKKSLQCFNSVFCDGSIKCAWCFSVNPLNMDEELAAALFSSVKGCWIAGSCCIEESNSKSKVGVTLNCASACLIAACTKA